MMPTRSRDLERRHGLGLPADISHIERDAILCAHTVTSNSQAAVERRFDRVSPSPCNQVREVCKVQHLDATDQPGLLCTCRGHNYPTDPSGPSSQNGG